MNIEIRKATISDLKTIQKLNLELCKKESKDFDPTINYKWSLSKEAEKYFNSRINKGCALVAFDGKKCIGYLVGGISYLESFRKPMKIIELDNMFIVENYRSSGIGTKLTKEFLKWAKVKKADRVKVLVSAQNVGALEFYKRNGFEDYNITLEGKLTK